MTTVPALAGACLGKGRVLSSGVSVQAEQAYGEKASRQLAGTMQQRDVYRGTQETAFSAEKLERLQTHGDELIAQCIQLAGATTQLISPA